VTEEDIHRIQEKVLSILNEEFLASKDYVPKRRDWLASHWSGFKSPEQLSRVRNTGYAGKLLVLNLVACLIFLHFYIEIFML
jgi:2-oxoglutarate dehydrogenase E1 component